MCKEVKEYFCADMYTIAAFVFFAAAPLQWDREKPARKHGKKQKTQRGANRKTHRAPPR
jgi:hypothetical protein